MGGQPNSFGQRMFGVTLGGGGQGKQLPVGQAVERNDIGQLRFAQGQRAGLVEQEGVGLGQRFQILTPLDHQASLSAGADRGQHGNRRGQGNRTGTSHHQHGRSGQRIATEDESQGGQRGHDR